MEVFNDFHVDAKTAYRAMNELGMGMTRFTIPPLQDHTAVYCINFKTRQLYNITRTKKPRRKITFEQVAMLLLTPIEAHQELIQSF